MSRKLWKWCHVTSKGRWEKAIQFCLPFSQGAGPYLPNMPLWGSPGHTERMLVGVLTNNPCCGPDNGQPYPPDKQGSMTSRRLAMATLWLQAHWAQERSVHRRPGIPRSTQTVINDCSRGAPYLGWFVVQLVLTGSRGWKPACLETLPWNRRWKGKDQ